MELVTIIVIVVLTVLAIASPLFSPFLRKPTLPERDEDVDSQPVEEGRVVTLPPVSIIITDHDNAYQLSQIIDGFLNQDYPQEYQVIVVVDETDHESIDVLKQRSDNPHLYYTKLPVTSRYISRKKLAMTVGMRASKYDWCIVTSVYCSTRNDQWLRSFCSVMTEETDFVIGMTPYERHTPYFWRYEHLRSMLYHLTSAEHGTAFSTNQLLVALHKEEFFREQGFAGNLEYQRAEFEFLVNKFAHNTALALAPSSWLSCKRPTKKQWYYRHMHGIDSFHDMRHSLIFRLFYHLDLWVMHLYNLLTVLAIVSGGIEMLMEQGVLPDVGIIAMSQLDGLLLVSVPAILWLISQVIRIVLYKPVLSYFDNVNPVLAVIYDWRMSMSNLLIRIRYKFTDRYDFMTHRL